MSWWKVPTGPREAARWLTVALVCALRRAAEDKADAQGFPRTLLPGAELEEILTGTTDPDLAAKRLEERTQAALRLPARLTGRARDAATASAQGVSPGTATGMLTTEEMLKDARGPVILHVSTPSPDLTASIQRAGGIISEHGGLLSHLAIIARDRHLPMITGLIPGKDGPQIGDVVEINGTAGTVRVLKKA